MTLISDLHQQWLKDFEYQAATVAQRPEFEIASAIIAARSSANLTQKELAELMSTKQSLALVNQGMKKKKRSLITKIVFYVRNRNIQEFKIMNE